MEPKSDNQFLRLMTLYENNWVKKYIDWFCFYYLDCFKSEELRLLPPDPEKLSLKEGY